MTAVRSGQVWVSRAALEEQVATLHPTHHEVVAAQIRELIGN